MPFNTVSAKTYEEKGIVNQMSFLFIDLFLMEGNCGRQSACEFIIIGYMFR